MKKFFALLLISALIVGCSKTALPDHKRTEQRSREAFNELERSTK